VEEASDDSLVPTRAVLTGHSMEQWIDDAKRAQQGQEKLNLALRKMKAEQIDGEELEEENLDGEEMSAEEEEPELEEEWEDWVDVEPNDQLLRASLKTAIPVAPVDRRARPKHPKRTSKRRERKKRHLASLGRTEQSLNRARSQRRKTTALKQLLAPPSSDDTDDTEPLE
jgi:hypothetical protein